MIAFPVFCRFLSGQTVTEMLYFQSILSFKKGRYLQKPTRCFCQSQRLTFFIDEIMKN